MEDKIMKERVKPLSERAAKIELKLENFAPEEQREIKGVYKSLLSGRHGWYDRFRHQKSPKLSRDRLNRYLNRAIRVWQVSEGKKEISGLSERTQKRYQRDVVLARKAIGRMRESPGTPPLEPSAEEEVPPTEKVEKISLLERLSQAKQELRKRFKGRAELKVGERAGALLEGLQRKVPHIDWKTLPPKAKEITLNLLGKSGSSRLAGAMEALGALISREKWNAVLERRKRDIEAGRKKIEEGLEKAKGVRVLATAGAVKKWVAKRWEGAVVPKKEDLKKTLEAKKAKMRMPEFRELSPKELSRRWEEMDPATRRKIAISVAAGATLGVTVFVGYEIVSRYGPEIQQVISSGISSLTQAGKELLARAPEIPKPPPEIREVVKKGVTFPQETSVQADEVARRLGEEMQKWRLAEQAAERVSEAFDLEVKIKQALAVKREALRIAAEQVRLFTQTGVEIVKGSHAWGASGEAAKQVFESSGVQSDPERLTILTDAIKDASELGDLVQPGTMLKLKPGTVADILRKTIESIQKVKAVGGTLEVPADEADLRALARVAEYLKGF